MNLKQIANKLTHLNMGKSFDYIEYWDNRYKSGGNSGIGSYNRLAKYKAEIINSFALEKNISSVIDFGCGDGNQLGLFNFKRYLGLDVASSAIDICKLKFSNDESKSFILYKPGHFINKGFLSADLVICLDVLYHITDESDFKKTLDDIFSCATKHIILYTPLKPFAKAQHICFRDIFSYLSTYPSFTLEKIVKPKYIEDSTADFIFINKK